MRELEWLGILPIYLERIQWVLNITFLHVSYRDRLQNIESPKSDSSSPTTIQIYLSANTGYSKIKNAVKRTNSDRQIEEVEREEPLDIDLRRLMHYKIKLKPPKKDRLWVGSVLFWGEIKKAIFLDQSFIFANNKKLCHIYSRTVLEYKWSTKQNFLSDTHIIYYYNNY